MALLHAERCLCVMRYDTYLSITAFGYLNQACNQSTRESLTTIHTHDTTLKRALTLTRAHFCATHAPDALQLG